MDYLPQNKRPSHMLSQRQVAEIIYIDREADSVVWREQFFTTDQIPSPTIDFPERDYTVQVTWREDWRR